MNWRMIKMRQWYPNLTDSEYNDLFIDIRGAPRPRNLVRAAEEEIGAKLVADTDYNLILNLDLALEIARKKLGAYPNGVRIPSEPLRTFIPIPYHINIYGLTLPVYHKPAWFYYTHNFILK